MKNLKNNKMLLGIGITFLLLATISMSYAWFSATVKNVEVKDQVVKTGTLELTYTDGTEIKLVNARPGATAKKTITVKNTGTLDADYNLVWQSLNNEITNDELVISISCKRLNEKGAEEENCEGLAETPIKENIVLEARDIPSGYSHEYTVTVTFKELSKDQNYNQGKTFTGVLGVEEYKEPQPIYCTFDGTVVGGTIFNKGIYTYTYSRGSKKWDVTLIDKTSTDPVTDQPCTYINNILVSSMINMFKNSQASLIDVSNFYTNEVTNMQSMFENTVATEIKGLEKINTSNVTNMVSMFSGTAVTSLDLSGFDTSKVTKIDNMFSNASKLKTIYISKMFVTDSVTSSDSMFSGAAELIGAAGTTYNENHVDVEYARVDGGTDLPGYFTLKTN